MVEHGGRCVHVQDTAVNDIDIRIRSLNCLTIVWALFCVSLTKRKLVRQKVEERKT